VHAHVVGKFGVEGGRHGPSLPHRDRVFVFAFGGQDFHALTEVNNFRSADENHFQRGFGGLGCCAVFPDQKLAFADGAVDLASVGIAADSDIECAEAGLGRVLDFGSEQDRAGAGAECGLGADEFFQLRESFFSEKFQERPGLASGDDQAVDVVELFGLFDEHNFGAELLEPAAVRVEIALQS